MVDVEHSVVTGGRKRGHDRAHVHVAVVQEGLQVLAARRDRPDHVAEVDVEDPFGAEVGDAGQHVLARLVAGADAVGHAVGGARELVEQPVERREAVQHVRDAAVDRDRRVVAVLAEADPGLLRHRQRRFVDAAVTVPDPFRLDGAERRVHHPVGVGEVDARPAVAAAPAAHGVARRPGRRQVLGVVGLDADQRDAGLGDVADQLAELADPAVGAGSAVVGVPEVLDRGVGDVDPQAEPGIALDHAAGRGGRQRPGGAVLLQVLQPQVDVVDADLLQEPQALVAGVLGEYAYAHGSTSRSVTSTCSAAAALTNSRR